MPDFSNWDFAKTFSGIEVASLMVGVDPSVAVQEQGKIYPVIQRLRDAYEGALDAAIWAFEFNDGTNGSLPDIAASPKSLYSHRMLLANGGEFDVSKLIKGNWLKNEEETKFENQLFTREEVNRWTTANDLHSFYTFKPSGNKQSSTMTRWPWGDHHTKLLGHLDLCARKFWCDYDPANPKGTAPKSAEVIHWLIDECKVSESIAKAMATLLRPDDLKTGPRK
jgi:hypothetical protein